MMRQFSWAGLLVLSALCAPAQQEALAPVGIAHVAVRVSDVEREVKFLNSLGFEEAFANTENGQTTEAFVKVNDRQFIEVYPAAAAGEKPGPLGLMHACYEAAALKPLYDRYVAAGLQPTSWRKAGAGNLLFNLQDPDGRVTEFTQYMPGSRQMNDMGQHLGPARVSDELMGFEMPVRDMKVAQKFYDALGFETVKEGAEIAVGMASNPDVRIVLLPAGKGAGTQFFLSTDNAKRAEEQLRSAGVGATRDKKQVYVRDPDGNLFVLVETDQKHPHHLVPWKK